MTHHEEPVRHSLGDAALLDEAYSFEPSRPRGDGPRLTVEEREHREELELVTAYGAFFNIPRT